VSFHTFLLPKDRCVCLLITNLGKQMPEDVVREELEALDICVQGDLHLRTGRRAQGTSKTLPLTPHFAVSVARGPEVAKLRAVTELCSLRFSVKTHIASKGPCSASAQTLWQ
jgi:hypothetical protein